MADKSTPGDEAPADKPICDHEFFLALAAKGKDEWNKWRRDPKNKDVRVTFKDVDFSEAPRDEIDFSGFEFGDDADFSKCRWRGARTTGHAAFVPGCARFTGAHFGNGAFFNGTTFGSLATFEYAIFGYLAIFSNANFGGWASFDHALLNDGASFDKTSFGDLATFTNATFGIGADLTNAIFANQANFADAEFRGKVNFTRAAFGGGANFAGANFRDEAIFDETRFDGSVAFNRQCTPFINISFAGARFDGEANFSGRSFEKSADFTNARFYYPPDFDTAEHLNRIDFTGTRVGFVPPGKWFHWTEDTLIPVRLRAFRKIAEETKNHDFERDLYVEERKAERGACRRQLIKGLEKAPKGHTAIIR